MKLVRYLGAAALALTGLATPILAQSAPAICGERDHIMGTIANRFGETPRSWGMGPGNRLVEVFASEETGTWTITVTSPNGTTCLVAAGQFWEDLVQEASGEAI